MTSFDGVLVFDKPPGMTSRDVVDRAQCWFPRRTKVGHAGTLDPLATGVLVVCVGAATRLIEYVQEMGKTYESRFLLGATSDTDDLDGTLRPRPEADPPTERRIEDALASFVGSVEQTPPKFSAAKVAGARAYDLARSGKAVELAPRVVRIDAIELNRYEFPYLDVRVDCGKGTYIRSIARDLGERLGCGGLVATLRRTRIGRFGLDGALSPDATAEQGRAALRPPASAVDDLPVVRLGPDECRRLRAGQPARPRFGLIERPGRVAVLDVAGSLVAVGEYHDDGSLKPVKIVG